MVIGAFDWWDRNGKLEYHNGNVRIYNVAGEKNLFVDQTMYACTTERDWYVKNIKQHARGKCLEIGLGLGVASEVILSNKKVTHLLTVENNPFVIAALRRLPRRQNILCVDATQWVADFPVLEPMYDFIFVDHYTFAEEELSLLSWMATALKLLLKPGGTMIFWVDEQAPEEDKKLIRDLWIVN